MSIILSFASNLSIQQQRIPPTEKCRLCSALSADLGGTIFASVSLPVLGWTAFITSDAVNGWYKTLTKPSWTPPNWLFGPAYPGYHPISTQGRRSTPLWVSSDRRTCISEELCVCNSCALNAHCFIVIVV
ncbi:hypothetical protein BJ742DRAFT_99620 [Cladochytrium replicatum]|nr:hypothetical protein BJ742DRAFT_99620 [Cladochytrium replicatum]